MSSLTQDLSHINLALTALSNIDESGDYGQDNMISDSVLALEEAQKVVLVKINIVEI